MHRLQDTSGNTFGGFTDISWTSKFRKGRYMASNRCGFAYSCYVSVTMATIMVIMTVCGPRCSPLILHFVRVCPLQCLPLHLEGELTHKVRCEAVVVCSAEPSGVSHLPPVCSQRIILVQYCCQLSHTHTAVYGYYIKEMVHLV